MASETRRRPPIPDSDNADEGSPPRRRKLAVPQPRPADSRGRGLMFPADRPHRRIRADPRPPSARFNASRCVFLAVRTPGCGAFGFTVSATARPSRACPAGRGRAGVSPQGTSTYTPGALTADPHARAPRRSPHSGPDPHHHIACRHARPPSPSGACGGTSWGHLPAEGWGGSRGRLGTPGRGDGTGTPTAGHRAGPARPLGTGRNRLGGAPGQAPRARRRCMARATPAPPATRTPAPMPIGRDWEEVLVAARGCAAMLSVAKVLAAVAV
ncbi:MAG: hypothetical protein JWL99_1225 [Streptomyces oryziradicis]|nr:hypothetical protein [Actinacidiphila oryziradicis]